ncbi:hypothetical protein BAUCODRAFT_53966, partial [Baudoinia panamericana UAMH 10762]
DEDVLEASIATVSFGALQQARDALLRKRKRGSDVDERDDDEEKLEALRKRLRQIKKQKAAGTEPEEVHSAGQKRRVSRFAKKAVDEDRDDASDSDSAPSEEDTTSHHQRSSKHAPTAQTSRRQVTRKRTVIDVPKRVIRDPRFDAIHDSALPTNDNISKAYSFLHDYERGEIAELQTALKRTKDPSDRETLKRKINSMENRLKTQATKEREQEVLRKHRKEERERVQQGKTPYYLKKKEVKERALVERFKGMKGKEREKVMERRRVKEGQKEKKRMPNLR